MNLKDLLPDFDFRDFVYLLVTAVLIAMLLASLGACKPIARVTTVTERRDSARLERATDSVYVYRRDSVYVREKGDTVLVDKWHILYRDRNRTDTCYVSRLVETPVVTEVEVPVISRGGCGGCWG